MRYGEAAPAYLIIQMGSLGSSLCCPHLYPTGFSALSGSYPEDLLRPGTTPCVRIHAQEQEAYRRGLLEHKILL